MDADDAGLQIMCASRSSLSCYDNEPGLRMNRGHLRYVNNSEVSIQVESS